MITLTLSNIICIYLCCSLIFWNLSKSTKSNDCLTMKFYTHYDMVINYTLLFILNMRSFEQILQTLEDIQGNNPDSENSTIVP